MSELEEKLASILSNPGMMQQIQSMAQAMSQPSSPAPDQAAPACSADTSALSQAMPAIQGLSSMVQQSAVDENQQHLLCALSPYLSRSRVEKLERAMRAAKMAGLASSLFQSGALDHLLGR